MGSFDSFTTPDKPVLVADASHLQFNIDANLRRSNCENQFKNLSKTLGPDLARNLVNCDALAPLVQTQAVPKPAETTVPAVVDNSTTSSRRILRVDPNAEPDWSVLKQKEEPPIPRKERFNSNMGAIVDHLAPLGMAAYVAKKTYDAEFVPPKNLFTDLNRAVELHNDAYRQVAKPDVEIALKELKPTAKTLGLPLRPFNFEDLFNMRNRALVEADRVKLNDLLKLYLKESPGMPGILERSTPELRELLKTTSEGLLKQSDIVRQAQNEAVEATRAFKLGNYGAIGGALAANFALDQTVFSDKEYSLRTIAADIASPALALTSKFGGRFKFAAIVGVHAANRLLDATESKPHY